MALVIGSNATVATGMSPIVESGLYADQIFIDGVSFTSKYNIGNAGQIQVEKYAGGTGVAPKTPGSNFTPRDYTNTVVNININNGFSDSVKVPMYFKDTLPTDRLMDRTLDVTQRVATGRQQSALAALLKQGSVYSDGSAVTVDNIKSTILNVRADLRKNHAKPNVVLASVDTYSKMLAIAGKDFSPMYNEDVVRTGKVGMWMGMLWIEADLLDGTNSSISYINEAGSLVSVTVNGIDFIMYDFNAFSIIDRLDVLRVVEPTNFVGSEVQAEIASGFLVTNPDCVAIKTTGRESGLK